MVYLVTVWSVVDYPLGFWLFVLGGCAFAALNRSQEVTRSDLYSIPDEPIGEGTGSSNELRQTLIAGLHNELIGSREEFTR